MPKSRPKILEGFTDIKDIAEKISRSLFLTKESVHGKSVSNPIPPNSAWLKGSLFASWSWGVWSDTIESIVPSINPLTISWRSSSVFRGGESFKNVL